MMLAFSPYDELVKDKGLLQDSLLQTHWDDNEETCVLKIVFLK